MEREREKRSENEDGKGGEGKDVIERGESEGGLKSDG